MRFVPAPSGRFPIAAAFVLAALAATLPQSSAAQALSLDAAVLRAGQQSQLAAAARAQADAARQMAVAAGQRPDPVLKAGVNNLPIDGPDRYSLTRDFMTMRSLAVMQEFTRGDKLRARSARAASEAELAEADRAATLAAVRRDTAAAWLERHFRERMRVPMLRQREEAALQVESADAAYRGGRGSQADVFAAHLAVAQIEDRLRENELQVAMATTRLSRWIGSDAERVLADPPDLEREPLDEQRLQRDIERQPQVALATSQQTQARAEATLAQANRRSDWSVELMFSQRGPAYSNMVSVNVAIPLQIDRGNRQDREIAGRLAQVEQFKARRDDAIRSALAEARVALQQWRSCHERAAYREGTLIPLAAQRTRAALAAYRGGSGPLAAVLDARRAEIDAQLERLDLQLEAAALWAQLAYLLPAEQEGTP